MPFCALLPEASCLLTQLICSSQLLGNIFPKIFKKGSVRIQTALTAKCSSTIHKLAATHLPVRFPLNPAPRSSRFLFGIQLYTPNSLFRTLKLQYLKPERSDISEDFQI